MITRFSLFLSLFLIFSCTTVAEELTSGTLTIEDCWDALLEDYVFPGKIDEVHLNVVDYEGISNDHRWLELLQKLKESPEPTTQNEKLAFWSNAYNIMAIKVVLSEYPVDSIKDIGGFFQRVWNVETGVVAGKMRTLTEIEHEILRKLNDARIHGAIVCASVSCPPLRSEAYRADQIDDQLDNQMHVWLANPKIGAIAEKQGTVICASAIFWFFPEDFKAHSGSLETFLRTYMHPEDLTVLKKNPKIRYFKYDWSLNDSKRSTLNQTSESN